jgi:hypothetical protein
MSDKSIQKGIGDAWNDMPTWQKWALGVGGVTVVAATGGAAAYAIATYGATLTMTTAGGTTVAVAVGKAALGKG